MELLKRLNTAAGVLFGPSAPLPQANTITTSRELEQSILAAVQGAVAGVSVTETSAMRQRAAATCVRVISEDIASLDIQLKRRDGERLVPARDHPVYRLLHDQPNEWMSGFEFREFLQRSYETRGNGYALKVRGARGQLIELLPMHPDMVKPVMAPGTMELTYLYTRPDGKTDEFARADILHIRGASDDGVVGLSTVAQHRETIGEAIAQQRQGTQFFANSARPGVVLEMEKGQVMSQESRDALKADFEAMYSGVENSGKTAILPGGISLKPLTVTAADAQYIEQRKFTRSEIAGIWRIPPHKIGDLERATFSNIEHQEIGYVTGSVTPRCRRLEGAYMRDLLGNDPEYVLEHNVEELMRGDAKSRAEANQIKRRNGILNANEWRADLGLNPRTDEGGDEYIVERNMGPDNGRTEQES